MSAAPSITAPAAEPSPSALAEVKAMLATVTERLNEVLRAQTECPHILTSEEAIRYVKAGSTSAFYDWAKKWGVSPASYGRWSRAALDMALSREAGLVRTPATLRKKQSARRTPTLSGTSPDEKRDPAGANQRGQ